MLDFYQMADLFVPEIRDKILENRSKYINQYANSKDDTRVFLSDAFVWRETVEGHDYWDNIERNIENYLSKSPEKSPEVTIEKITIIVNTSDCVGYQRVIMNPSSNQVAVYIDIDSEKPRDVIKQIDTKLTPN